MLVVSLVYNFDAAWWMPTQVPYAYSTTGTFPGQMPRIETCEMAAKSVKESLPSLPVEPHASCNYIFSPSRDRLGDQNYIVRCGAMGRKRFMYADVCRLATVLVQRWCHKRSLCI